MKKITWVKSIILFLFALICFYYIFIGFKIIEISGKYDFVLAIIMALFFPICMIFFYRKIDVFEPEKYLHLFLVFFLSGVVMHLIGYPIIGMRALYYPEFKDSAMGVIVGVGLFEELLKILPVILFLKLPVFRKMKMINEPIDYVIYASVSALSFAFFENIQYIYNNIDSGIPIVAVRSLMSLFMHTFWSSLIGFGLFCMYTTNKSFYFFKYLMIAAILHGLFDIGIFNKSFLILNFIVPIVITIGGSIYYGKLIQSLLNVSPFYNESKVHEIKSALDFLFLIIGLVFVLDFINYAMHSQYEGIWQNLKNYNRFIIFALGYIYYKFSKYLFIEKGSFIFQTTARDKILADFYKKTESS